MRYGPDARSTTDLGRVIDARAVDDLDHAAAGPGLGQDAQHVREALVHGACGGEGVDGRLDMLTEHARQDAAELQEGGDQLAVELVARLGQHPGGQEERHRLVRRQVERRQERAGLQAPATLVLPDGQLGLGVHGLEVAVGGALRDADLVGDLLGADALRMGVQDHRHLEVAGRPIPLESASIARAIHP